MSIELLAAKQFILPSPVAAGALKALREHGEQGDELFIALTAVIDETDPEKIEVRRGLIPTQTAHRTPDGLLVTIDGDALFALSKRCYELGETLVAQIHAHPGRAYHSSADDQLAFVRVPGSLSIVVPDFARAGLKPGDWSINRLGADGRWSDLPNDVEFLVQ